nr:hypothetical protein [uncultured Clostridium sp.]
MLVDIIKSTWGLFINILKEIGGAAILIAISTWIGKILINKAIEKEKKDSQVKLKELQNKIDEKMMDYQYKLNNLQHQQQLKFQSLHEERLTIIKNLYIYMAELQDCTSVYIRELIENEYIMTDVIKKDYSDFRFSAARFMDYGNKNRIYFNKKIGKVIDEVTAMCTILLDMSHPESVEITGYIKENKEVMDKLFKYMGNDEVARFKESLEIEFKKMLGVQEDDEQNEK